MAYHIQILGLREFEDPKSKKLKKYDAFLKNNWVAESEEDIFLNPLKHAAKIPNNDRWNMYFTVARCFPEKGRKLAEQWLIPWDIDDIGAESQEDGEAKTVTVAQAACDAVGVQYTQTAVVFSGNGAQFFIKLKAPILSDDYFDSVREHYGVLAGKIQVELKKRGLKGEVDPTVFSHARLMRLPMTANRKPGKAERNAVVIQPNLVAVEFDVMQRSGLEVIKSNQTISKEILKKYPKPDTKAILAGCDFLKFCFEKPAEIKEFQWYAATSITARLDSGEALTHQMSEGHPGYNSYETDEKIKQALRAAGPRTCENVNTLWDGCKNCKFNGEVTSPILIRGPKYIKTIDTGFRTISTDENGNIKTGKINFEDLIQHFEDTHEYIAAVESEIIYTFNGKHWVLKADLEVEAWAGARVNPKPSVNDMVEFRKRLIREARNIRPSQWYVDSTYRKMNFQNGVLNLDTMELEQHSPEFGFMHVLPYAYDPRATCPSWDSYLDLVLEGNQKDIDVLNQFGGYAIAGGLCLAQKALILVGHGGNGKSVYSDTLAKVVGSTNYSTLMLDQLSNDQHRYMLVDKLFNYSDESPKTMSTPHFKTMVTGGEFSAKLVYKPPFQVKNRAKFIALCNDLPEPDDFSDGLYDRLLLVKFDKKVRGTAQDDKQFKEKMWEKELPGICNKLISGFKKLIDNKYAFDESDRSIELREEYRLENNTVSIFAQERLKVDSKSRAPLSEIYSQYAEHCKSDGEKPLRKVLFFKHLRNIPEFKEHTYSEPRKIGSISQRCLINCELLKGEFDAGF